MGLACRLLCFLRGIRGFLARLGVVVLFVRLGLVLGLFLAVWVLLLSRGVLLLFLLLGGVLGLGLRG